MLVAVALLVTACGQSEGSTSHSYAQQECLYDTIVQETTIPIYAHRVIEAYPDFKIEYAEGFLVFPDGTNIVYDDGMSKNFTEKLDDCDIDDMFSMTYDQDATVPAYLNDPGRGRNEPLFQY